MKVLIDGQEYVPKIKKRGFVPPTHEELAAQIKEKNYQNITPDKFINFYGSKGWMVGKTKMVNWRLALARADTWDAPAGVTPKAVIVLPPCLVCQKPSASEQQGKGLCEVCKGYFRKQQWNWGHLKEAEIEKMVEQGKTDRPRPPEKPAEMQQRDKVTKLVGDLAQNMGKVE